jgi:hypothetical protein
MLKKYTKEVFKVAAANEYVKLINSYLSDYILVILLVGGGVWFTLFLRGIQFRGIGTGLKMTFGGLFS